MVPVRALEAGSSAVVLVLGKGGVGKTTVAAGLAQAEARVRGSAALVEFGDGEPGRRVLGADARAVEHVVVAPRDAITRLGASVLGSALLARAVLDNFAVQRFLQAAPAIREVAMLESVRAAAAERPGRRVFVDMPATGHGVAWLRVPAQLGDLLRGGPLFDVCDRLARGICAPGGASIVIVTLPERLVLLETLELWRQLTDLGMPPAQLLINRFPPALPERALEDARRMASERGAPASEGATRLADVLVARTAARKEALEVQQKAKAETGAAPLLLAEQRGDPSARAVADLLAEDLR